MRKILLIFGMLAVSFAASPSEAQQQTPVARALALTLSEDSRAAKLDVIPGDTVLLTIKAPSVQGGQWKQLGVWGSAISKSQSPGEFQATIKVPSGYNPNLADAYSSFASYVHIPSRPPGVSDDRPDCVYTVMLKVDQGILVGRPKAAGIDPAKLVLVQLQSLPDHVDLHVGQVLLFVADSSAYMGSDPSPSYPFMTLDVANSMDVLNPRDFDEITRSWRIEEEGIFNAYKATKPGTITATVTPFALPGQKPHTKSIIINILP